MAVIAIDVGSVSGWVYVVLVGGLIGVVFDF